MSAPARERSAGKTPRRRVPPVSDDLSTELRTCIARLEEEGRVDLLEELVVGLREVLRHPASENERVWSRWVPDA